MQNLVLGAVCQSSVQAGEVLAMRHQSRRLNATVGAVRYWLEAVGEFQVFSFRCGRTQSGLGKWHV
jgi:hypothetical protein